MYADLPKPLLETLCSFLEHVPLIHVGRTRRKPCRPIPQKSFARRSHLASGEFGFPVLVGLGLFIAHAPTSGRSVVAWPSLERARLAIGRRFRQDVRALWNCAVATRTGVLSLDLASSRNLRASKYRDSVIGTGFRDTLAGFWEAVLGQADFVPLTSVLWIQTGVQQRGLDGVLCRILSIEFRDCTYFLPDAPVFGRCHHAGHG